MEKQEIREMFFRLEHDRRRLLAPYFTNLGLTLGQGQPRILTRLLKGDGLTQRELADACNLDATTLSRTLDRMEEAGLISRQSHPSSRRAYRVLLTESGRQKAKAVLHGFSSIDKLIWQGFSEEEMDLLYSYLKRISQNLESLLQITPEEP